MSKMYRILVEETTIYSTSISAETEEEAKSIADNLFENYPEHFNINYSTYNIEVKQ